MMKGTSINNTAVLLLSPSAAVTTPTSATVSFPNNSSGMPVQIRVSGSVSGAVILETGSNSQIAVPVNPNAPFTTAKIPKGSFKNSVTSVSVLYLASGAGSITVFIDFN